VVREARVWFGAGLARRSRIGWHERNTIVHVLAKDGRILTQ
jgi:hypothetical protein